MTTWTHAPYPHHEVNVVHARGTSLDALTTGLRSLGREPLDRGEADDWAWVVHEMLDAELQDFDPVDYRQVCPEGAELVVIVTEPCSPKGFPPEFEYYRAGRLVLRFNFEDPRTRAGDDPDHLSPELLAARLIGPDAECPLEDDERHACWEHADTDRERLMRTIADHFRLPSPPLASEVTGR
ncbi:hypothetical protein [Streptomyces sp. NPDC048002]|uniref:hypothetical protein n=1 Tax=Streptomyces sp. NPDC048002 TaxID=3154344 RepID=UPI0033E7BF4C